MTDKPYYSLDTYCKETFHEKCYKIAINANMTCPNRDGTLDTRGCIFCSKGGSGDFASTGNTIEEQIARGKSLMGGKNIGKAYIAYFQAYTNTYASIDYLESIYAQALSSPDIIGISIATRPDCLSLEVIHLIKKLASIYSPKFIWIELGLQTIHEKSATFIRRGYSFQCFDQAAILLQQYEIPFIVHLIVGLPNETPADIYESVMAMNYYKPFGLKLQLLHVLKDTDLATYYMQGNFKTLTQQEYIDIIIHSLELLSPDIVIHRLTGDGPKELLLAPMWSTNKRQVLNQLHRHMKLLSTYQGRLFECCKTH